MNEPNEDPTFGKLFWLSLPVGAVFVAVGAITALRQHGASQPVALVAFLVGLWLIHDLVVAPTVFAVGAGLRHRVGGRSRAIVQAALIVTGVVTLVSIPFVAGWGRDPQNPSLLPGNYAAGLFAILVATWVIAGVSLLLVWRRAKRTP